MCSCWYCTPPNHVWFWMFLMFAVSSLNMYIVYIHAHSTYIHVKRYSYTHKNKNIMLYFTPFPFLTEVFFSPPWNLPVVVKPSRLEVFASASVRRSPVTSWRWKPIPGGWKGSGRGPHGIETVGYGWLPSLKLTASLPLKIGRFTQ